MKEKLVGALLSDSNVSSRREFMKTAGKLAIYTPPAIMLLMHPSREAVACISLGKVVRKNDRKFHRPDSFSKWDRQRAGKYSKS